MFTSISRVVLSSSMLSTETGTTDTSHCSYLSSSTAAMVAVPKVNPSRVRVISPSFIFFPEMATTFSSVLTNSTLVDLLTGSTFNTISAFKSIGITTLSVTNCNSTSGSSTFGVFTSSSQATKRDRAAKAQITLLRFIYDR